MRNPGLAFAALALVLTGVGPAAGRGSGDGVYTTVQASEGAQVYARQCGMCHGARLEGTVETPGLTGKFVANWGSRPLGNLFDYLARAMPQTSPGTLDAQDNARLIAFILQANGAPPGDTALPADRGTLNRLEFEAPGNPAARPR